jgi:hypothetical protein
VIRFLRFALLLFPLAMAMGLTILALHDSAYAVLAVPIWLFSGTMVAAVLPGGATDLAIRRRVALVAAVVLFTAGALPIDLTPRQCGVFVFELTGVLLVAGVMVFWIGKLAVIFRPVEEAFAEVGEPSTWPKARSLEVVEAEISTLRADLKPRFDRFMSSLSDQQRERFNVLFDADSEDEGDEEVAAEFARLWMGTDSEGEPGNEASRLIRLERERAVAFVSSLAPLQALTGLAKGMRAIGPALLAVGFVLFWMSVFMIAWALDPSAWNGLGQDAARLGNFVYLAVSGLFGGGGNGIEARTAATRLIGAAEAVSAATFFLVYLQGVLRDDTTAALRT